MHVKWNNAFSKMLAASAVALMATSSLYAIPRGPCEQKPVVECGCPEVAPGPFAFAFPYDANMNCPSDIYFYADFLAFQAKQEGMDFAIIDENGTTAPLTNGLVGGFSSDHRDWEYNFGARFGIGFYTDHDAWNIDAVWTWLNIRDYKRFNSNTAGSVLIPLWELGSATPADTFGPRSSAVWSANYNVLDVRLGKPYYISRYVVFNPHIGVRGGWIDQHFSVDYGGSITVTPPNRTIAHGDNDFWGVGLRTGVDTCWGISSGFSIFGNAAASLLYGKFKVDQKTTLTDGGGINLEDQHYMNVPNAEIAMGLAWGTHFSENKYYLSMKAAYEFHIWFNQLNMRRFWDGAPSYSNDVVSRGNLTLNGFSFRVSLDI